MCFLMFLTNVVLEAEASFFEAYMALTCQNEVIEDFDPQKLPGGLELARHCHVIGAWRWVS